MVRGDPRPAPYERHLQPQGPEIKTEITDFNFTEQSAADEALVNRRYASSTWKTGLQPEDSATYACRWMYSNSASVSTIRHSTFHEFMTIVHDLLSDYGSDERNKILSKLRKLQRRNEVMGSHGPNFRPAFTALYGTDKHDTTRGSVEPHRPIDLPAFVSIPTIHFHESSRGSFPKRSHRAKSLLQYYYRHGISDDADLESPFDPSTIFSGPRIPQVRELWCLAVDKKNLISVSFLGASAIWPFAGQESQSSSLLPPTALFAINEYFQEEQENIPARLQKAASLKQMTVIIRLGLVGLLVSFFVPGGWMLDRLSQSFQKRTFGINSSEISRLYSFISTLCRGLEVR
ncbi:hypothetical protein H9Q74_012050 [Fusarium xylarioides]|nr:hypothetical protein H9Q71_011746 [Fusarium xylarioides]KAG5814797.1 hypothetical protein H9Q74_012050 [Fusarium xylarioides]